MPYIQSLIAERVVDVACTCYCAIGTCIHMLLYVHVCVQACVHVCVCVATIPYTYNHHYQHNSVIKVTIYACIQYMRHCSRKRPPPPSHSASYNITFTTCMCIQPPPLPQHNYATMHAFSICATALEKDHQHLHSTKNYTTTINWSAQCSKHL